MTGGAPPPANAERILGRYALFDEIASGGMATVHLGRMLGPVGFSKTVAIKRLHPHLARDPEFVSMFLDEARLAARVQHPNVVATLDVVAAEGEVFLVLDYVQGETLSHLLKATRIKNVPITPRVLASTMVNTLHGLHAAHEASDEHGHPLGIVHRDVSPQNILVGTDGVARVLDFGVAKAAGRLQSTRDGQLKGKLAYMAPEQIRGDAVDRRTDIYAAAVVLWEGIVGRRLVHGLNEGQVLAAVLAGGFPPPSSARPGCPPEVDALVMRGLAMNPEERWPTAREFAIAVERTIGVASPYEVAEWAQAVGAEALAMRAARVREMESTSAVRVSLHDAGGPQVFHDPTNPQFARGRSGITSSSVSQPGLARPMPPALPQVTESTGSVFVHPSLAVQDAPPAFLAPPMMPQAYAAPVAAPAAMPAYPAAPKPAPSKLKVILISVAASLFFGIVVIVLLIVLRARSNRVEPAADVAPVAPKSAPSAASPEPTPSAVAVPAPSIVDVPPVAVDEKPKPVEPPSKPANAEPATKTAAPVKTGSTASAATTKPPTSATAAKPAKGCETPFFVDSSGIKHVKPECM